MRWDWKRVPVDAGLWFFRLEGSEPSGPVGVAVLCVCFFNWRFDMADKELEGRHEALAAVRRDALRSGVIPVIN